MTLKTLKKNDMKCHLGDSASNYSSIGVTDDVLSEVIKEDACSIIFNTMMQITCEARRRSYWFSPGN